MNNAPHLIVLSNDQLYTFWIYFSEGKIVKLRSIIILRIKSFSISFAEQLFLNEKPPCKRVLNLPQSQGFIRLLFYWYV